MRIYIAKDSTIDMKVSKAVTYLNSKCDFLKFEELLLSFQAPGKFVKHPQTHKKYLNRIKPELKNNDFIIIVTEIQYDNNYFYEEENGLIILSFFAWKYLTSLPIENGLVYLICGMLIDEVVPYDAVDHTERLGCVNDFLDDKTRVDDGMRKGSLCNGCKQYLKKHKLSKTKSYLYHDISTMLKDLAITSNEERNVIGNKKTTSVVPVNFSVKKPGKLESNKNNGTSLFISYSHKDEKDMKKLENHLRILQRIGLISTWTDREITAGEEWKNQIDKNLSSSKIILMLISSNFISSDYCYDIEMKTAITRHDNNEAIAIPIILRDCLWQMGPFAKLQALPQDGKPIQQFPRKDEAYTSIARAIARIIKEK